MKICIPTADDRQGDSSVHDHFGSAPYFAFADTETGDIRIVPNPRCHEERGSCHHVRVLEGRDVQAVVCGGIGKKALAGLQQEGIDVLSISARTVAETC